MDIKLLDVASTTAESFNVQGFKKCSGVSQLAQLVAIDFLREVNSVLAVGGGAESALSLTTLSETKSKVNEAVSRTRQNILRNQKLFGKNLKSSETLKSLTLKSVTDASGSVVIELNIEASSGETASVQI